MAGRETSHSVVALSGPLDTEGIDTVLELTVSTFHLRGDGPINPPFRLMLRIRTRLIRIADRTLIHEAILESATEKRKFVEWAENDAQSLRQGLDRVALTLATDIVARVLAPENRRDNAKLGEQGKAPERCKDTPPLPTSSGGSTRSAGPCDE